MACLVSAVAAAWFETCCSGCCSIFASTAIFEFFGGCWASQSLGPFFPVFWVQGALIKQSTERMDTGLPIARSCFGRGGMQPTCLERTGRSRTES